MLLMRVRRRADEERGRDLPIGATGRDQRRDLTFPGRKSMRQDGLHRRGWTRYGGIRCDGFWSSRPPGGGGDQPGRS